MRKVLMMLLVLILAGCDDFCAADKAQGHREGYEEAGLDNQNLKIELAEVKASLNESKASNEWYKKRFNELRIKQDFNNRLYVALVSSCHNFFIMNCGVVSSEYTELVKAGVTPSPGWIIGFDIIFLFIYVLVASLICLLSSIWLGPRKAEIERTQKFVDNVEDAVAERLKSVNEDIFTKYEKAKLKQDELEVACREGQDNLVTIIETFNEELDKIEELKNEKEILDNEIEHRLEIRETLKFEYEDKKD